MTPRTASLVSRSLIGIALLMIVIWFGVSRSAFSRADTHEIVVAPSAVASQVAEAAAALRRDPGAQTDPALADAPQVMLDKQNEVAKGDPLAPATASFGAFFILVVSVTWMATGSLIVRRQPHNAAGWVFLGLGFLAIVVALGQTLVYAAIKAHTSVPFVPVWAVISEYALYTFILLPFLWLLFPDGHPPSPRWRWAMGAFLVAAGVALLAYAVSPGPLNNFVDAGILYMNPLGIPALATIAPTISGIGGTVALFLAVATIFGVRGRFKRASGDERQQLRWLVFVATLAGALFLLLAASGFIADTLLGADEPVVGGIKVFVVLFSLLFAVIVLGTPGAYLIAIYRYHLWDLDVVIKKALVFAVVAGGLTVVALGVLLLLPVMVVGTGFSGWERGLFVVGVAVGTLFGPLRRLARKVADRVVYHTRATPYEVLTEFSGRVGETYATDDVLPRMAQVLAIGAGAASARVLLSIGGEQREVASFGPSANGTEHLALVIQQGEELGALAVTMPPNDPMDPAREKLMNALAAQAGPVLRNVRLIEELRASRQRLVAAQDDERRKIERNLHDGSQQQLVALAIQLRLLEQTAGKDPERDRQLAAKLGSQANAALEDLRDLARGIYPPLLADKGLGAALEAQARKAAVPTTVTADGIQRYPQEIEAAVYFCVLEALNNVAKYASATRAAISLRRTDGQLAFEVGDDGSGFDVERARDGTGLQGMADRLDAIGGSLTVRSVPGEGSTVGGRVPLAQPPA
jgi:signal transduction histidine kinase